MKRITLALTIVILAQLAGLSQNLVKNYSFETFTVCPTSITVTPKHEFIRHWYNPNFGTPDYYNACNGYKMNVPENDFGYQEAVEGQAYAALILKSDIDEYREYIQQKLKRPMIKDSLYCIRFYTSLADRSILQTNRIGLHISTDSVLVKHDRNIPVSPQIFQFPDTIMYNVDRWYQVIGTYQAKGNEQFITIGNFANDENTFFEFTPYYHSLPQYQKEIRIKAAYYFVDNVFVYKISNESECGLPPVPEEYKPAEEITYFESIVEETEEKLTSGTPIILSNIYFEVNRSSLLPESFVELDKLAEYLIKNSTYKIEVSGHTDISGSVELNQRLSEARAQSVKNYLISKGIDAERIYTKGYASKFPIGDNRTMDGRQMNRRVEFRILKFKQ